MSTKTTLKRIALVAVSALGFGLMTVVPSAQAAQATTTLGTAVTSPAVVGREMEIDIPVTFTAGSVNDAETISVLASTVPVGANTQSTTTNAFSTSPSSAAVTISSGPAVLAGAEVTTTADLNNRLSIRLSDVTAIATTPITATASFFFTPSVAGSYTLAYFKDVNANGAIDSGDTVRYVSFTAVTAPANKVAISTVVPGTYSTAASNNSAWLKIQVQDSAGAATVLSSTQQVRVTMPTTATLAAFGASGAGSKSSISGGVSGASYGLSAGNFGVDGVAYLEVTSTTVGTHTISAEVLGGAAASSLSVTYADPSAAGIRTSVAYTQLSGTTGATFYAVAGNAGNVQFTAADTAVITSTLTPTLRFGSATASGKVAVKLSGAAALFGGSLGSDGVVNLVVTVSDTLNASTTNGFPTTAAYTGTLAVPSDHSINANETYKALTVTIGSNAGGTSFDGTPLVITGAPSTASTVSLVAPTSSTVQSVAGATISATLNCKNQFGVNRANTVLTPSFATGSRNAAIPLTTVVTNSSGNAVVTWTDASSSTTNLQDVLRISGCGDSSTTRLTVNYSTAADYGVSTLAWSAGGGFADSTSYVGANITRIRGVNDPSTNSQQTLTFTVKDVNGAPLVGVPVTFTLAGNAKSLIVKTATVDYSTVYTNASGEAQTRIFAWGPGTSTVTATAGSKTATGYHTYKISNTVSDARVLSGSFANGVLSFKVVDRFGNGVEGVTLSLSRTGTGYFGTNGQSTATPATGPDGTVDILFNGTASVRAELPSTATQAFDVAGKIATATPTAAVAGTTTGTGDTLTPAGVWNVTVATTEGTDASTTAANAAADAAAEAIDAANAATDAANLAAEAADAATVAAEEARDAADAATAAVEELATQVATLMAALKAQITTLANTVAKIARKVRA